MNRKITKAVSVIMSAAIFATCTAVGSFAADGVDYKINSTYEDVNWSTYKQYKTDLHSHSTASDGSSTKKETVEEHYKHNFDILAITDHGTIDYGWNDLRTNKVVKIAMSVRKGKLPMEVLADKGQTSAGKDYTFDGSYYTEYENGVAQHSMMRVPFGNEQNPTSFNNAHVCTWFVDYGNNTIGGTSDYETPISNVDKLGGLSVINHPGEYSGARNASNYDEAYNTDNIKYKYVVNKFANILTKYPSCLGIDVNSKGDYRTRYDRKLWDILLQKVVPTGRNVYGLATSDSHNVGIINSGYTLMCMPNKTVEDLRACMEDGAFFAASYYMGSKAEIQAWSEELKSVRAASDLAEQLAETYDKIVEEENGGKQSTIFAFDQETAAPRVSSVSVDDRDDTITLSTKDAYMVHWIADGKVIATGNKIDLDDYSDEIGSYVRAEVIGKGGVIYTQPFTLEYDGAPEAESKCFVDLGGVTTLLCDTIVKALVKVLEITKIVDIIWYFLTK